MKLLLVLIFSVLSLNAFAQALNDDFKELLVKHKIGPMTDQAYCYSEDDQTLGYRSDKLQRIASITKLFSTLLVSETMDLHSRFTTRIFVGKDSIHIDGGKDPYFEEEKLLLMFKALNDMGYTAFKKITFSESFLFYDVAMGEYQKITPKNTRLRLAYYTNQKKNKSFLNTKWAAIRKFAKEEGIDLDAKAPALKAQAVAISNINPLLNENPIELMHTSLPFHQILKSMNVQSKNYVAENVYIAGSLRKNLSTILIENNIDPQTFKIYNGSGLPIIKGNQRTDNLSTCDTLMRVFQILSKSLTKHQLLISDVIALNGGKDLGSFRGRFLNYPELDESVVSKTGTLKHTSTLGGFLLNGVETPFAILNHTTNTAAAKKFQDDFVSRIFDVIGPPVPFAYEKISIFPWNSDPFFERSY